MCAAKLNKNFTWKNSNNWKQQLLFFVFIFWKFSLRHVLTHTYKNTNYLNLWTIYHKRPFAYYTAHLVPTYNKYYYMCNYNYNSNKNKIPQICTLQICHPASKRPIWRPCYPNMARWCPQGFYVMFKWIQKVIVECLFYF